jgi:hypothetical protein
MPILEQFPSDRKEAKKPTKLKKRKQGSGAFGRARSGCTCMAANVEDYLQSMQVHGSSQDNGHSNSGVTARVTGINEQQLVQQATPARVTSINEQQLVQQATETWGWILL